MTRVQRIYNEDFYDIFTSREVCELTGLKYSLLVEIADKLNIGRITSGTYRFTKPQVEKLKDFLYGGD